MNPGRTIDLLIKVHFNMRKDLLLCTMEPSTYVHIGEVALLNCMQGLFVGKQMMSLCPHLWALASSFTCPLHVVHFRCVFAVFRLVWVPTERAWKTSRQAEPPEHQYEPSLTTTVPLSTTLCVPPAGYTIGVCYNGDGTYSVVKDVKVYTIIFTVEPQNSGHFSDLNVSRIPYLELVEYTNVLVWRRTKCLSFRGVVYSEVLTSLGAENQVYFIGGVLYLEGPFSVLPQGNKVHTLYTPLQEGDVDWESGEGVRMGGRLSERDGSLLLEGFVGDRLISANIAVVNDSLHIFTPVYIFPPRTAIFCVILYVPLLLHIAPR